jgi:hypothetical protein
MHIIGVHNNRAGGSTRHKLLTLTDHCIRAKSKKFSYAYDIWLRIKIWTKIFLFENALWIYKSLFGFLEVTDIKEDFIPEATICPVTGNDTSLVDLDENGQPIRKMRCPMGFGKKKAKAKVEEEAVPTEAIA